MVSSTPHTKRSRSLSRPLIELIIAVTGLALLLLVWNLFSQKFTLSAGAPAALTGPVYFDTSYNENSKWFLSSLPAKKNKRILIFGSSQIFIVKSQDSSAYKSIPHQIHDHLASPSDWDVICYASAAQQVIESLLLLLGSSQVIKPDIVVMGVGLFSMQGTIPRKRLLEDFDPRVLTASLRQYLGDNASQALVESISSYADEMPKPREVKKSLRQEYEEWLMGSLKALPMVANRQLMFDELLDKPVRRDLIAFIKRHGTGVRVARTVNIGPAYEPSLTAIRAAAGFCKTNNIRLLVVVLPFESTRPPVACLPETHTRIMHDLSSLSQAGGFELLDLGYLLDASYYGDYQDGSPDNFHFSSEGHRLVGQAIARAIGDGDHPQK